MCETVVDQFYSDLFRCLTAFADNHSLPQISDFNTVLNRENGSKIRGDFSLNFVSPKYVLWHQLLTEMGEHVVQQSSNWSSFSVINFKVCHQIKRIQLFINRQNAVQKLFQQFCVNQEVIKTIENLLIICDCFDSKNELTAERTKRVCQSLSKIMNTSFFDLNNEQISDDCFEQLLELASLSPYCQTNDRNELLLSDNAFDTNNTKSILIDKTSRKIFNNMWNLYQLIANNTKTNTKYTVIIVTLESHSYRYELSFMLMSLLYNLRHSLKIIPVSNVISNYSFVEYRDSLKQHLMAQNEDSIEKSLENIDILVETSMTLSLLTTFPSSVITKLEPNLSEATFIQYNCARITAIINRYEKQSIYKSDDHINLSLLTHDLEWTLIFNHFTNYYSIIYSLNNFISNKTSFKLNQIVLFLKKLVTDISVFYKKIKVLTEPCLHLLPQINARIYLCKTILTILSHCLDLLGLKSVKYL